MLECVKYLPADPLKPYVVRYWLTEATGDGDIFVIPDAYPELLFIMEPGLRLELDGRFQATSFGGVVGQFAKAGKLSVARGSKALWVKLFPFTAALLFPIPGTELTERITTAEDMADPQFRQLIEQVVNASNLEQSIDLIETFLIGRIYGKSRLNPMISSAVHTILRSAGKIGIESLALQQGVGIRHLQKTFKRQIGFSPSFYRKQIRTKAVSLELLNNDHCSLASLAYDWGYTDQSHLNKEFKSIVGLTPSSYRRIILNKHTPLLDLEIDNR